MARVILGLGSNLGRKLEYLRRACGLIEKRIAVIKSYSAIYQSKALLPADAPIDWDIDYYNLAIEIQTVLSPENLLAAIQAIEIEIGRAPDHTYWSPREIDIDILAYDTLLYETETLSIPHKDLLRRAFALAPLLEIAPNFCHPGLDAQQNLHQILSSLPPISMAPFSLKGTKLMAIINLSTDSFSDQRVAPLTMPEFEKQVVSMIESGAEVIDIGAESTRSGRDGPTSHRR